MSDPQPPSLFSPLRLGTLELPNRIVTASASREMAAEHGKPSPVTARHYALRAAAGLIVTEPVWITPEGAGPAHTPGIWRDTHVAAWREVTAAVHAAGGRIALQLWHAGRLSHPLVTPGGVGPVAPSAIAAEGHIDTPAGRRPFPQPRQLATEELPRLVQDYALAARRAVAAGFDAVEILAGDGSLLEQFLQAASNRRTDAYGGAPAARARLVLEVASAVAQAIGPGRTGLRLTPRPDIDDAQAAPAPAMHLLLAQQLRRLELAWLHVVAPDDDSPDGAAPGHAAALRAAFGGKVILSAGHGFAGAEAALRDGEADAIALDRPLLASVDRTVPLRTGVAPFGGGRPGAGPGGEVLGPRSRTAWFDPAAAWQRGGARDARHLEWEPY